MSSAHLKSPPSSLAGAASSFDASFTSPVYKVVLLPGASYSSPRSKLVPCRPEPARRKVARRDSVPRQLRFPITGTDSDSSFDGDSVRSLGSGINDGPPKSCSDFTEEELRSLPMYERLPIKLEDLCSDDESDIGVKNAVTISPCEALGSARTQSVLLQPNGARRELQVAHCYGGETNPKTCLCPGGMEEKYPKQLKFLSRRTLMATFMTRWVHFRELVVQRNAKERRADDHVRRKILQKAFHVWRVWLLQQADLRKESLRSGEKYPLRVFFRRWKALHLEGVAIVGVVTERSEVHERRCLAFAFCEWKKAWELENQRKLIERKVKFRNKRKAFSAWRLYIYICNLKELCTVCNKQREMGILQSSFSHWEYRTSLLQGDKLVFSRLACGQRRELMSEAFRRWREALCLSRRAKSAHLYIQHQQLMKLRLQEHQMKREAEQYAWGVCLRVHFDLWRKRMDERKERALDGRAREAAHLHYVFRAWRNTATQHSRDLLHQFLVRLQSSIPKGDLSTAHTGESHQTETEQNSPLTYSTLAHGLQSSEFQSPAQQSLQGTSGSHSNINNHELGSVQFQDKAMYNSDFDSTGMGQREAKISQFQDVHSIGGGALFGLCHGNLSLPESSVQYQATLPWEGDNHLSHMTAIKEVTPAQDPLLTISECRDGGDGVSSDDGGGGGSGDDGGGGSGDDGGGSGDDGGGGGSGDDGGGGGGSGDGGGGGSGDGGGGGSGDGGGGGSDDGGGGVSHRVPGAKWKLVTKIILMPHMCKCMNAEASAQIQRVRETLEHMSLTISAAGNGGLGVTSEVVRDEGGDSPCETNKTDGDVPCKVIIRGDGGDVPSDVICGTPSQADQGPTLPQTALCLNSIIREQVDINTTDLPDQVTGSPHDTVKSPFPSNSQGTIQSPSSPSGTVQSPSSPSGTVQSPSSPPGTIQSPSSPPGTIQFPFSLSGTVQSPSSPLGTVQSPSNPHETVQSSSSPSGTVQSPSSPSETVQFPSNPPGTVQSPSPSDMPLLARLIVMVRYMRLYPCSKLFLTWRAHTQKMGALRGSLVAFQGHTLQLWFGRWRELTRASMKLTNLEMEVRQRLSAGGRRRCIQLWRRALQGRVCERSREALATHHHSCVVVRSAFSKWRYVHQRQATVEAERAMQGWEALVKKRTLREWTIQVRRRRLVRRMSRRWRHFARVRHFEKQAQILARYWTMSNAWSTWRREAITQRTLTCVTNTSLLRMAFLLWRSAVHQASS
eukprot:Em0008g1198a